MRRMEVRGYILFSAFRELFLFLAFLFSSHDESARSYTQGHTQVQVPGSDPHE